MYISSSNTQPLLMPIVSKQKLENMIFEGVDKYSTSYQHAICILHKDYDKQCNLLFFSFTISFVAFFSIAYGNRKTIPIWTAGLLGMCICPFVLLKINSDYENKPLSRPQISDISSQVMTTISQINGQNSLKIKKNIERYELAGI